MGWPTKLGVDLVVDDATVYICHGPPRCDGRDEPCPYCYIVHSEDPRSTDEIIAAMRREQ